MDFYGFSAPGTGVNADGLRTEKAWKDYFDCGFNVMNLTGKNSYCGEGWQGSNTQKCFEFAKNLGVKKIMMDDSRIYDLADDYKDKLVGESEDCRFKTEEELDAFIEECMKEYIFDPLFYGLRLRDEPQYCHLKAYGETYRSIKRVAKKLGKDYVHIDMNLLPISSDVYRVCPELKELTATELYTRYVEDYLRVTEANCISVDNYPYHLTPYGGRFFEGYYSNFQILKRVCDKYNAKMIFTLATFEMEAPDEGGLAGYRRVVNVNEMMLQMNSALGFGAQEITFYTYVTMALSQKSPFLSRDGSSCITSDGTKTWIWHYTKATIQHAKKLEKVLEEYAFKGAKILLHESVKDIEIPYCADLPENLRTVESYYLSSWPKKMPDGSVTTADFDNSYSADRIKGIEFDKDVLLYTHFENKRDSSQMFMFLNINDKSYKFNPASMKLKVDFGSNVDKIKMLKENDFEEVEIPNGTLKTELSQGEAVWVIIE